MAASQPVLIGPNVVTRSIAIMREFEPPEGYYLAFSGGKDSTVLLELAKRAGVKFDAHYSVTGIDPPELVRFIREQHPEVHWERPRETWWRGLLVHGLPMRTVRWCCRSLKEEHGGRGRRLLTGIRAAESAKRSRYGMVRHCARFGKYLVSPILAWTDAEVWDFIRSEGLPYCELYDQGWKRIGCVPCPFESPANTRRSLQRWPRIFAATEKQARKYWEKRKADGGSGPDQRFATFEDWWNWWLARRLPWPSMDDEQSQPSLFGPD